MKFLIAVFVILCILLLIMIGTAISEIPTKDDINNLKYQHYEEMRIVESYYYELYEDLLGMYEELYDGYKDDPGRTAPIDDYVDPNDIEHPLDSYSPYYLTEPEYE